MANKLVKTRGLFRRGRIWYTNITENGREVVRSTRQTSKAAAVLELEKLRTIRNEGHSILARKKADSILTFGALCDHFYQVHLSHKRMNGALEMLNIWKNGIGANTALKDISSLTIQKFFEAHRVHCESTGRSFCDASFNRHLTGMKAMYTRALKEGWITGKSPVANVDRKPVPIGRTRFLTIDEVNKLLGDTLTPLWLREAMTMALHTALRAGEMEALRWTSVNLAEKIITVTMSKSGKGRQIPISGTLLEILKRRHAARKGTLVFSSPTFGPEAPMKNFSGNSFRKALERAGITDFRWHDLRHSAASWMLMSGADLSSVQQCLGHASQIQTQKYAHLSQNHVRNAVMMLDQMLSGTPVRVSTPEGQPVQQPVQGAESAQ